MELHQTNTSKAGRWSGGAGSGNKSDPSDFPGSVLRIGTWEYKSRYDGDLVAKCYFAKHKLAWEFLDGGHKNRIEIQWSDIMGLKANYPEDAPGTLDVVLARQPLFFTETKPQPRKHSLWRTTTDFTSGQASINRRHYLECPGGYLGKHFEKLIECDPRLNFLNRQAEIALDSPYFEPKVSVSDDQNVNNNELDLNRDTTPPLGGLGSHSESYPRETPSPCSVPASQYNPLSPLGLRLKKSPELLDLIQMKLTFVKFHTVQKDLKECHQYSDQQVKFVPGGEINVSRKIEGGKRKTALCISSEDLQPHFGKRLEDVANELGVGRSTIKRACRFHGIHRWPSKEKHRKNPSLFKNKNANEHDRDTNIQITQNLTLLPEIADVVTTKAKYKDDIVKFQLDLSSGMDKLLEEVAKRFNLKMGSFKLKYVDEDNDEILLTCDVDLQLWLKGLKATGKNFIQVLVQLISSN